MSIFKKIDLNRGFHLVSPGAENYPRPLKGKGTLCYYWVRDTRGYISESFVRERLSSVMRILDRSGDEMATVADMMAFDPKARYSGDEFDIEECYYLADLIDCHNQIHRMSIG